MKKIVRIITRLNIGGPAQQVISLCEKIPNSFLIFGNIDGSESNMYGDIIESQKTKSVPLHFVKEMKREISFANDIKSFFKIYRILNEIKPDIVHTHLAKAGMLGRSAAIVYKFLHNWKLEIYHTYHGHVLEKYYGYYKSLVFRIIESFLALFCGKLIAVSMRVKKDIVRLKVCRENKILQMDIGIDLSKLINLDQRKRDDGKINFGIIGRLTKIKNQIDFIKIAKMFSHHSIMQFFIIGNGEDKEKIQKEIEGEKNIHLLDWILDKEKLYENLDVVVLTSLNEGMPLVLVEAGCAGRVLISTDVGGAEELVLRMANGYLSTGDIDDLFCCFSLCYAFIDNALELANLKRGNFYNRFHVDNLINNTMNLYRLERRI